MQALRPPGVQPSGYLAAPGRQVPAVQGGACPWLCCPFRPSQTNPASAQRLCHSRCWRRAQKTSAPTTGTVPSRRNAASLAAQCAAPALPGVSADSPATSTGQLHMSRAGCVGTLHPHPPPLLPQSTPGSALGQSHAGTTSADTEAGAWMRASAGKRRNAATPAAAGSASPCPEVAGTACLGGAGHQTPRVAG